MQIKIKTVFEFPENMDPSQRIALLETLIGQMSGNELIDWAKNTNYEAEIENALRRAEAA